MRNWRSIRTLRKDVRGTSAVEYGMILALVVLAMFAALSGVARETLQMWSHVETEAAKAHGAD